MHVTLAGDQNGGVHFTITQPLVKCTPLIYMGSPACMVLHLRILHCCSKSKVFYEAKSDLNNTIHCTRINQLLALVDWQANENSSQKLWYLPSFARTQT